MASNIIHTTYTLPSVDSCDDCEMQKHGFKIPIYGEFSGFMCNTDLLYLPKVERNNFFISYRDIKDMKFSSFSYSTNINDDTFQVYVNLTAAPCSISNEQGTSVKVCNKDFQIIKGQAVDGLVISEGCDFGVPQDHLYYGDQEGEGLLYFIPTTGSLRSGSFSNNRWELNKQGQSSAGFGDNIVAGNSSLGSGTGNEVYNSFSYISGYMNKLSYPRDEYTASFELPNRLIIYGLPLSFNNFPINSELVVQFDTDVYYMNIISYSIVQGNFVFQVSKFGTQYQYPLNDLEKTTVKITLLKHGDILGGENNLVISSDGSLVVGIDKNVKVSNSLMAGKGMQGNVSGSVVLPSGKQGNQMSIINSMMIGQCDKSYLAGSQSVMISDQTSNIHGEGSSFSGIYNNVYSVISNLTAGAYTYLNSKQISVRFPGNFTERFAMFRNLTENMHSLHGLSLTSGSITNVLTFIPPDGNTPSIKYDGTYTTVKFEAYEPSQTFNFPISVSSFQILSFLSVGNDMTGIQNTIEGASVSVDGFDNSGKCQNTSISGSSNKVDLDFQTFTGTLQSVAVNTFIVSVAIPDKYRLSTQAQIVFADADYNSQRYIVMGTTSTFITLMGTPLSSDIGSNIILKMISINNAVAGENNTVIGDNNFVVGEANIVYGNHLSVFSTNSIINGSYGFVEGLFTSIGGIPVQITTNPITYYVAGTGLYCNTTGLQVGDILYFPGSNGDIYSGTISSIGLGFVALTGTNLPIVNQSVLNVNTLIYAIKLGLSDKIGQHVEGNYSIAHGNFSHAEGESFAIGDFSHSEGFGSQSIGINSHSEGRMNISEGDNSHSEGSFNRSIGDNSHSEGNSNISSGENSHSEGSENQSTGINSHSEGNSNISSGENSHSEGFDNTSAGRNSHTENQGNVALGENNHLEGLSNEDTVNIVISHMEGNNNSLLGSGTSIHIEGTNNILQPGFSLVSTHVEGSEHSISLNIVNGHIQGTEHSFSNGSTIFAPHVEGERHSIEEIFNFSHLEGRNNVVSGQIIGSHIEGQLHQVPGNITSTHLEGETNILGGTITNSHIEGDSHSLSGTITSSHIEGVDVNSNTTLLISHIEGADHVIQSSLTRCHIEGTTLTIAGVLTESHIEGGSHNIQGPMTRTHIEGNTHSITTGSTLTSCHVEGNGHTLQGSFISIHVGGSTNALTGNMTDMEVNGFSHIIEGTCRFTTMEGNDNFMEGTSNSLHMEGESHRLEGVLSTHLADHIEGFNHRMTGNSTYSHIEGSDHSILCSSSDTYHIEGKTHTIGLGAINPAIAVHIEGRQNSFVEGNDSHVEGFGHNVDSADRVHVEGRSNTIVNCTDSYVGGFSNNVGGQTHHVHGYLNILAGSDNDVAGYLNDVRNGMNFTRGHDNNIQGNNGFTIGNNIITPLGAGYTYSMGKRITNNQTNAMVLGNFPASGEPANILQPIGPGTLTTCFQGNGVGSACYVLYSNNTFTSGATLSANQSVWGVISSKGAKIKVGDVDFIDYIEKFDTLELENWVYNYDTDKKYTYCTPYIEDLKAKLGCNDDTRVDTMELDSILFRALKGCYIKHKKLEERVSQLEADMIQLKNMIKV
jgi:hypothetical protein